MRLLPLLFVLVLLQPSFASAQDDPCDPRALLPRTDPSYADAMDLARTLTRHDISVRCVLLSKEAQMFEGQLGALFSEATSVPLKPCFFRDQRHGTS